MYDRPTLSLLLISFSDSDILLTGSPSIVEEEGDGFVAYRVETIHIRRLPLASACG